MQAISKEEAIKRFNYEVVQCSHSNGSRRNGPREEQHGGYGS